MNCELFARSVRRSHRDRLGSLQSAKPASYWLHRRFRNEVFPESSRGHLVHHFLIYGPRRPFDATA